MVGPEAEKSAQVRIFCRMCKSVHLHFSDMKSHLDNSMCNATVVCAGSLKVPMFTVVLRKGYGLGAQAMAGGSFHVSASNSFHGGLFHMFSNSYNQGSIF